MGRPAAKSGEAAIIMIRKARSSRMIVRDPGKHSPEIRDAQTPGIAFFSGRSSTSRTNAMPSASSEQSSQNDE